MDIAQPHFAFDVEGLEPVPAEMLAYVRLANAAASSQAFGAERRRAPRHPIVATIPAVPVDERDVPTRDPFLVVSRNLSTRGIALVHTARLDDAWLAIEMSGGHGEKIQIVVQVVRCEVLGHYFEHGCQFLRRLGPRDADD